MNIRFSLPAVVMACFLLAGTSAYAQPVPGCNPQVLDGMQKKAQAKVAMDVNITETIIDKPDSILAMICANNAFGTSAVRGGQIFSGDFTAGLAPIIENALQAFFDDFMDGAGFEAGLVDYAATALANVQDCNETQDLWSVIKDEGIAVGAVYATLNNLVNGILPAGADPDEYTANWNQEVTDGVFTDLQAALAALPVPAVPAFAPNQTACQVLQTAGVLPPGPCP